MSYLLSKQQVLQFVRDGFLVLPGVLNETECQQLVDITEHEKKLRRQPFELEAEVAYPGAPESINGEGGKTIRRLLNAYRRHEGYKQCAKKPQVIAGIKQLLRSEQLFLNENHHNCIMTKEPQFSSQTNWHRDTRYWSFNNKYLINAWFALRDERQKNGGMLILPGSHRWDIEEDALDQQQFLKPEYSSNHARLLLAEEIDLNAGDCLLFSAHCFHAAGRNRTQLSKYSLVFTYHSEKTTSLPNSKSSQISSVRLV